MQSILFGLKLWSSDTNLLEEASKLIESHTFNFIELSPIPGTTITPFLEKSVPYFIHISPDKYGINIADESKEVLNSRIFTECIKWADKLNAKYIIIHPGYGEFNNSVTFLEKFDDPRFLVENMPKVGLTGEKMIGYDPEQLQLLIGNHFGFCFDLNHAVKAAISSGIDYKEWILRFLHLNPKLFHISDGRLVSELDEHLNIGEGRYDWHFLIQCIQKSTSNMVTLETPRLGGSIQSDIENLRFTEKYIKES